MSGKKERGLLIVYTGDGKGKTTAALGIVFRALGWGKRVAVVQFIKGKWKTGERNFAEGLTGLTFLTMGEGFTWESEDVKRDKMAAIKAWETAKDLIVSDDNDIVILDELTYVMKYGFIPVSEIVSALINRPEKKHVVVTGRDAPEELIESADLVTEMAVVKHPYQKGIPAQKGVDF